MGCSTSYEKPNNHDNRNDNCEASEKAVNAIKRIKVIESI